MQSSTSVINLSSWLIKSTQAYLTMKNTMWDAGGRHNINILCLASNVVARALALNENETTLLLSANYLSYPGQINRSRANLCCDRWYESEAMRAHKYLIIPNEGQSKATTTKYKSIASTKTVRILCNTTYCIVN